MKALTLIYNSNCVACIQYKEMLEGITSLHDAYLVSHDLHDEPIETIGVILSLYERGFVISQLPFIYNGVSIVEGFINEEDELISLIE